MWQMFDWNIYGSMEKMSLSSRNDDSVFSCIALKEKKCIGQLDQDIIFLPNTEKKIIQNFK